MSPRKNAHALHDLRSHVVLTLPAVLFYSIFFAVPAISGIFYSLTDWNGLTPDYQFVGFANYVNILKDSRLYSSLGFNFRYTLMAVLLIIPISLGVALLLNSNIRGRGFFRSVFFFPAVLSLITVGLIFNQIFYRPLPLIGEALGIPALSGNILGNRKLAIYGILITNVWQGVAMPTVIFLAGLQSVPNVLYEAAMIDGANARQRFFSVTLPFLMPMFTINMVTTVRNGLTVFDYITALTNGGPARATESIGLLIYKLGFSQYKFGYGAAASIVLLILIVILSVAQIALLGRKEAGQQ